MTRALREPRTLWTVIAAVLAAAAIAIVVVVVTSGGSSSPPTAQQQAQQIERQVVPSGLTASSAPQLGLKYRYPKGWVEEPVSGSVQFTSPDSAISVAISTAGHGSAAAVLADSVQVLLSSYSPARVIANRPGTFAGRQVKTEEILGRNDKGKPLRVLALAARSPWKTYSVAVFSGAKPSLTRLAQAKVILDSVRFTKPAAAG